MKKIIRLLIGFIRKIYSTISSKIHSCIGAWKVKTFKGMPRISRWSKLTFYTHLGKNTNFNGMSIYGKGKVVFGDNFHSGKKCKILTEIHDYEGDAIPYDSTIIVKNVTIEDNVWFGDEVLVLGGVTIGEGAIIQSRSVVVSNIPKYAIAGGHPAKQFKKRNIENYEILKKKGKFH